MSPSRSVQCHLGLRAALRHQISAVWRLSVWKLRPVLSSHRGGDTPPSGRGERSGNLCGGRERERRCVNDFLIKTIHIYFQLSACFNSRWKSTYDYLNYTIHYNGSIYTFNVCVGECVFVLVFDVNESKRNKLLLFGCISLATEIYMITSNPHFKTGEAVLVEMSQIV